MSLTKKKRVEVCYSPRQFDLYKAGFNTCVVIDVLRATTAITVAIDTGVKSIIPVSTVEEAKEYQDKGYLAAAERGGKIVEGFDFGNSPYTYMNPALIGKEVVLTTTNGTKSINIASEMKTVIIGALVNLDAVCDWLIDHDEDVLLLGSGWKDKFNLEDTICAGAIADTLIDSGKFYADEDSTVAAKFIFRSSKENMFSFLKASSHRRRLRKLNLNKDINYCLTPNTVPTVPILEAGKIVKSTIHQKV